MSHEVQQRLVAAEQKGSCDILTKFYFFLSAKPMPDRKTRSRLACKFSFSPQFKAI